jgi:hypothetical protein
MQALQGLSIKKNAIGVQAGAWLSAIPDSPRQDMQEYGRRKNRPPARDFNG